MPDEPITNTESIEQVTDSAVNNEDKSLAQTESEFMDETIKGIQETQKAILGEGSDTEDTNTNMDVDVPGDTTSEKIEDLAGTEIPSAFSEVAEELGIPILIHTGATVLKGCRVKHVHPLMIDDVAFDFPDLKIICAHLGCWQYMDAINMLLHHSNVFADISFWPLHPMYVDLVPWSLLEKTLSDKILLGSDYPVAQTPKEAVEAVNKLPISQSFKDNILGKNAAKILNL